MSAEPDRADEPRRPEPQPDDSGTQGRPAAGSVGSEQASGPSPRPSTSADALDFGDPLTARSSDDTDSGWGERRGSGTGGAADLARFLDEKPPHHL